MSNPQKTPDDYIKEALTRSASARAEGAVGEALVWLGTAAILDSDTDRRDPCSPVNTALFQLVFDAAYDSETRVLKCGNITHQAGEKLRYGADALEILASRLDDQSPEAAHSLVVVLKAHFAALFRRFSRHYDPQLAMSYIVTTGADAKFCLDTTRTVRELLSSFEGLKVEAPAYDTAMRTYLLHICVTSPDYEVHRRLFRIFNIWDKALFFIEGAQYLLEELKTTSALQSEAKAKLVVDLGLALERARVLTERKDPGAKASYKVTAELCKSLVGTPHDVAN